MTKSIIKTRGLYLLQLETSHSTQVVVGQKSLSLVLSPVLLNGLPKHSAIARAP